MSTTIKVTEAENITFSIVGLRSLVPDECLRLVEPIGKISARAEMMSVNLVHNALVVHDVNTAKDVLKWIEKNVVTDPEIAPATAYPISHAQLLAFTDQMETVCKNKYNVVVNVQMALPMEAPKYSFDIPKGQENQRGIDVAVSTLSQLTDTVIDPEFTLWQYHVVMFAETTELNVNSTGAVSVH